MAGAATTPGEGLSLFHGTPMKLLVTGCGRSGTQYTAAVLEALGIRTTHERVYTPDLIPGDETSLKTIAERWQNTDAECSWLAAPFIPYLPEDVIVLHQVRHPLKVIRCWASHRLLSKPAETSLYARRVMPELEGRGDVEGAATYWYSWNLMIEANLSLSGRCSNTLRYRVENVPVAPFFGILRRAGHSVTLDQVEAAFRDTPHKGACHHVDSPSDPTWESLSQMSLWLPLTAKRYGYQASGGQKPWVRSASGARGR